MGIDLVNFNNITATWLEYNGIMVDKGIPHTSLISGYPLVN